MIQRDVKCTPASSRFVAYFTAGDTLLLELASSPGRIMGDASGRWGIGAVPEGGLAATLHVFSSPELVHPLR